MTSGHSSAPRSTPQHHDRPLSICCDCVTTTGARGGDFSVVTGSGTVTVNLLNAASGGHATQTFSWGTIYAGEGIGDDVTINSDSVVAIVEFNGSEDVTFTGGAVLEVGGFIDVNGNGGTTHMADDGDLLAVVKTLIINGNQTYTLTY